MRGRDFDSLLTVYRLETGKGLYGEITSEFIPVGNIRANRVKSSGRRSVAVGEQYPVYTSEYYIRDGNAVREGWRVLDADSKDLCEIVSVIHDRRNRSLLIKCVSVNPNGDPD